MTFEITLRIGVPRGIIVEWSVFSPTFIISQFTLYADASKGNRPSYIKAMKSDEAIEMYELFNKKLKEQIHVETGEFGADMKVSITNDGPVTIWLESGTKN